MKTEFRWAERIKDCTVQRFKKEAIKKLAE